jgi:hypothetical protein
MKFPLARGFYDSMKKRASIRFSVSSLDGSVTGLVCMWFYRQIDTAQSLWLYRNPALRGRWGRREASIQRTVTLLVFDVRLLYKRQLVLVISGRGLY